MRHPIHAYAKALAEAAHGPLPPEKERAVIKNFIALLKKNGDLHAAGKILAAAGTLIREKEGRRKITIESARKVPAHALMKELQKSSDIVEEKTNPELVAGVRVVINDELQFDGSLRRKLNELFKRH